MRCCGSVCQCSVVLAGAVVSQSLSVQLFCLVRLRFGVVWCFVMQTCHPGVQHRSPVFCDVLFLVRLLEKFELDKNRSRELTHLMS